VVPYVRCGRGKITFDRAKAWSSNSRTTSIRSNRLPHFPAKCSISKSRPQPLRRKRTQPLSERMTNTQDFFLHNASCEIGSSRRLQPQVGSLAVTKPDRREFTFSQNSRGVVSVHLLKTTKNSKHDSIGRLNCKQKHVKADKLEQKTKTG